MAAQREDILRCLFQTVGVLLDTAMMNDPYQQGHRLRTSQIARTLAQILGFEDEVVNGIRLAATLHDIGMLLVPQDILNKPDRLTPEEFSAVKQHPVYGVEILKDIEFPWPIAQMILQHHERLDGSGYPHGIGKGEITLESQIIAIADVMDAMTSDRPWRRALTVDEALNELRAGRGSKFDAFAVDSCIDLYVKQRHRLDPEYYGRT
jgi:putative nucleotidyltransferase with HDIG domain